MACTPEIKYKNKTIDQPRIAIQAFDVFIVDGMACQVPSRKESCAGKLHARLEGVESRQELLNSYRFFHRFANNDECGAWERRKARWNLKDQGNRA
jgi:hypothetical protein